MSFQLDLFSAESSRGVCAAPQLSPSTAKQLRIASGSTSLRDALACHIRHAATYSPGDLNERQGAVLRSAAAALRRLAPNGLFFAGDSLRPGAALSAAQVSSLAAELDRLADRLGDKTNTAWISESPVRFLYSDKLDATNAAPLFAEKGDDMDDEDESEEPAEDEADAPELIANLD